MTVSAARITPAEVRGPGILLARVRLLAVPLALRAEFTASTDGLLRELALIEIGAGHATGHPLPQRLLELAAEIRTSYAPFQAPAAADVLAAEAAGLERCDLEYTVPADLGAFVEHLGGVLDEADALCRDEGPVLAMPPTPEVEAYRRWVFSEFVQQLAGAAPRPWDGPVSSAGHGEGNHTSPVPTRVAHDTDGCGPRACEVVGGPFELPPEPASVALARRHVRAVLRAVGASALQDSAELGTSELVTNAVLHAGTAIVVTVCRSMSGPWQIAVTDSSPQVLQPRHSGTSATTGRGLELLSVIAADWGVDARADGEPGKTVWFEPLAG